jgi:mRNA interferase RelE/StbE
MNYFLKYRPVALRQLAKLGQQIQARLKPKKKALADNPRPPDCKKLQGFENLYRIMVGNYRVIYEIHDKVLLVLIVKVGSKQNIYS